MVESLPFRAYSVRSDGAFRRMWRYYLLSNAGNFRVRRKQVWQIVYSHDGTVGGYGDNTPANRTVRRRRRTNEQPTSPR